jgi:EAL domain-containing protein (putative c-di-GMP-specific phosphodiesterase class I)
VNLFPVQFRQETLIADVEAALAESCLPADAGELEITENIALDSKPLPADEFEEFLASGGRPLQQQRQAV